MKLNQSPKIFENYKSDYPKNTIKRIENGFKEIGLTLKYKPGSIQTDNFACYFGGLLLDTIGFSTHGKGKTPILAKAATYAEMAERFSAGFFYCRTINYEKNIKKYNEILNDIFQRKFLKGFEKNKDYKLTDIKTMKNYFQKTLTKNQYIIIEENKLLDFVVDAYSFLNKQYIKVPILFIENISGSTGIASGNTIEEAIVQGSCEIFERYAASKIISEKIECPTIQIESIQNETIQKCIEMFRSMNIEILIKDFTLNNKLPVIGILLINNNLENNKNKLSKDLYHYSIHAGSHFDFEIAILRCFIEYMQKSYADDAKELMYRRKHDLLYDLWTNHLNKKYEKNEEKFKYFTRYYIYFGDLTFLEKGRKISFEKLKNLDSTDFIDDVNTIANICIKNGWDFQIIDYTHKVIKLPTVRVIIPPISTDCDPFVSKLLDIKNYEERFNTFHGIKDFYKFINDDNWMNDKKKIQIFIKNIEDYLSSDITSFDFSFRFEFFNIYINLFHVLAFSNLAIERYDEALKYFEVLLKLDYKPNFLSSYFNELFKKAYDPSVYSNYIKVITEGRKDNKKLPGFTLTSNPLKRTVLLEEDIDYFSSLIFTNIKKSYF